MGLHLKWSNFNILPSKPLHPLFEYTLEIETAVVNDMRRKVDELGLVIRSPNAELVTRIQKI